MSIPTLVTVGVALLALLVSFNGLRLHHRDTNAAEKEADATFQDDARSEAVALADTRGKRITDLSERLNALEQAQEQERHDCAEKINQLRATIDTVREEAAENQRMLMVGLRGVLMKVLSHLEVDPPEVPEAIEFLRDALQDDAPPSLWRRTTRRRT